MSGPPSSGVPHKRLGAYEIIQWLATGGMAEVYVARRTGAYGFTKNVALKRILPQFVKDPEFVAMFVDEARVCAGLSHPNLVEVFDFGEDGGELYMAMELVEGTTGARLVRAAAARGETVPIEDTLYIVLSVLRGLDFAHGATDENGQPLRLVHRDVSPGNVLLSRTGAVKLADFGIVRAANLDRRTEHGQLKGKLGYMSPEQVLGREIDARSDLFTLGIVMAELLTAKPLFSQGQELDILFRIRDADTAAFTRAATAVPEDLRAVVYRALAKDPDDRYPTALAFAEAIEEVIRRRRLTIGPTRLAAYLEHIGLVRGTSRSGEYRLALPVTPQSVRIVTTDGSGQFAAVERTQPDGSEAPRAVLYRVRTPDGVTTDPIPLPRVLELFVAGRVPGEATVSREDGPFLPAREHAELRRVTTSSAHRWEIDLTAEGAVRFGIAAATLPGHLFGFAARRETGVLHVSEGLRRKKVYLVDGDVEYATSTEREEMLGSRLVRDGLVLPVELDMALAMAPRFGGRVGDALVGLGILRPIDVFRALSEQMRDRITDLLRFRQGDAVFLRGARSHEETLPQPASTFELVAKGVASAYPETELVTLLHPLSDEILAQGARTAPSPMMLRLSEPETDVLLAVDGVATLADVLRETAGKGKASRVEALRALFIGLSAGAITTKAWPPAASSLRRRHGGGAPRVANARARGAALHALGLVLVRRTPRPRPATTEREGAADVAHRQPLLVVRAAIEEIAGDEREHPLRQRLALAEDRVPLVHRPVASHATGAPRRGDPRVLTRALDPAAQRAHRRASAELEHLARRCCRARIERLLLRGQRDARGAGLPHRQPSALHRQEARLDQAPPAPAREVLGLPGSTRLVDELERGDAHHRRGDRADLRDAIFGSQVRCLGRRARSSFGAQRVGHRDEW